ncbi:MAG: hypothetical protein BWY63_03215 [Chloroflexi bacterium ADurb.Bin360]|nr:MAG: hypothetical protein BWY63_03215 [Chloroflexi bacterium ADurb.Bin360]
MGSRPSASIPVTSSGVKAPLCQTCSAGSPKSQASTPASVSPSAKSSSGVACANSGPTFGSHSNAGPNRANPRTERRATTSARSSLRRVPTCSGCVLSVSIGDDASSSACASVKCACSDSAERSTLQLPNPTSKTPDSSNTHAPRFKLRDVSSAANPLIFCSTRMPPISARIHFGGGTAINARPSKNASRLTGSSACTPKNSR